MRYSYGFKRKCVELYYQGRYPDTPEAKLELVAKVIAGESIKSAALMLVLVMECYISGFANIRILVIMDLSISL